MGSTGSGEEGGLGEQRHLHSTELVNFDFYFTVVFSVTPSERWSQTA